MYTVCGGGRAGDVKMSLKKTMHYKMTFIHKRIEHRINTKSKDRNTVVNQKNGPYRKLQPQKYIYGNS